MSEILAIVYCMTTTNMRVLFCVLMTLAFLGMTHASKSCTVDDYICDSTSLLTVSFGTTLNTYCEVQLSKSVTVDRPVLNFYRGEEGQKYLLLMVDPDAGGCFVHDIETVDLVDDVLKTDKEVVKYKRPNPPSSVHCYQIFLYTWGKTADDVVYHKNENFILSEFKEANQLDEAVAVFQFLVASSDY